MAGREDTKNNRDGRSEKPRDDPQSSSTQPETSSPHNSTAKDGDGAYGQRQSNTPHGSSAPPHEERSAVIAPPATITVRLR